MSGPEETPAHETGAESTGPEKPWHRLEAPVASPALLKALAHPVRQQIFRALTNRGHARATDLAEQLGLPANQISFHLRVLADAEIIEEAPEYARDKRDRVWTMKSAAWELGNPAHPVEDEALGNAVMQWVGSDVHALLKRVVAWGPEWTSGRDTEVRGTLTQISTWLTRGEFEELIERLGAIVNDLPDSRKAGRPGAHHWDIAFIAADDTI